MKEERREREREREREEHCNEMRGNQIKGGGAAAEAAANNHGDRRYIRLGLNGRYISPTRDHTMSPRRAGLHN